MIWSNWRGQEAWLVGVKKDTTTLESSLAVSNVKYIYPNASEFCFCVFTHQKGFYTNVHCSFIITIVHMFLNRWTDNLWYIYTVEYCSATKGKGLLIHCGWKSRTHWKKERDTKRVYSAQLYLCEALEQTKLIDRVGNQKGEWVWELTVEGTCGWGKCSVCCLRGRKYTHLCKLITLYT